MTFEERADVHTTRPRQVLSQAHMCASGKCHVQCEILLGLNKLRNMCVRQGALSTRSKWCVHHPFAQWKLAASEKRLRLACHLL